MKNIRIHTIGKLNVKDIPEKELDELLKSVYQLLIEKKKNARKVVKKEDK